MFQPHEGEVFEYKGGSKWSIVSAMKASKMLLKGCVRYLASIVDTTKKVVTDVRVACKFPDVFPENCWGYHPIGRSILRLICYMEWHHYPKLLA